MYGQDFEPFAEVAITVDGSPVGSVAADEGGSFWFDHSFAIGHEVTADDGITAKTHIVTSHTIGVVDHVENTATGTADPLTWVTVEVSNSPANLHREVQADAAGVWFTDVDVPDGSGQTDDITPFTPVNVWQTDDDDDNTTVTWQLPRVEVDIDYENMRGRWFTGDASVTIFIDGTVLETVTTDPDGYFEIAPEFDLMTDQVVTVVGPEYTKTLLLTDPQVTDLDAVADTVSGTAEPLAQLDVWAAANPWSEATMRVVTADGSGAWTADFSVPVDGWSALDIESSTAVTTYEWDDDGDATIRNFGPPVQQNRGVAVTPIDNHVWVANSGVGTVTRLDNDGNILAVIDVGDQPTGVAVDAAGKVWVTNLGSDSAMRIDPNGGTDGLGVVDLTVDLGEGAGPYNYSDMTGAVVVGSTSPQGFWTVVQDSGEVGFEWGRITWNTEPEASEPAGSAIVVEARTADTPAGLGAEVFAPVANGELFSSLGRYIEVRVTLKASPDGLSPVLSDIRVQPAVIEVDVDIKPGSHPNTINVSRVTGVVPVAVLGSPDFDVTTIDVATLRFGPDGALPTHTIDGHLEDVDLDGFVDLVSHYVAGDTGLVKGDTEACVIGSTLGGIPIHGCDSVRMR
jgi:DNA-binding beta-propeller fold protein YncE